MLATIESFDEMLADAVRQATRNNALAHDTARSYFDGVSAANLSQVAAIGALQHAMLRSALDVHSATVSVSRSVADSASALNRALIQWAAAVIWPWQPLGILTEPAGSVDATSLEEEPSTPDTFVDSALQFQGPMGLVACGMGEIGDY